ncbi:MAG: hypothetical protein ABIY40_02820 [Rhodanobacteraceae bacterium]
MTSRRFLPYKHLQTARLGLLLGTARMIAWIGMLLIALGIIWTILMIFLRFIAFGPAVSMTLAIATQTVIALLSYGLLSLAFSGILAALVGIEDSQRRRAERDAI